MILDYGVFPTLIVMRWLRPCQLSLLSGSYFLIYFSVKRAYVCVVVKALLILTHMIFTLFLPIKSNYKIDIIICKVMANSANCYHNTEIDIIICELISYSVAAA